MQSERAASGRSASFPGALATASVAAASPAIISAASAPSGGASSERRAADRLYSAEERRRRDDSPWTLVQGVLAPVQFAIFVASLVLVLRFLATGVGETAATASVVVKTCALYAIMITGSIWEKAVFGRWLFARSFWWEDLVSMLVLALHSLYLVMLVFGMGTPVGRASLALAAYASYVVNAGQFLLKLRAARHQSATGRAAA